MLTGAQIVEVLRQCGVTHVVWIPDSELGTWETALSAAPDLQLVRVAREGEALAVAVGLWLGGKRPIVMLQITGLFEAGDALRNAIHDLKVPLFLIIGLRGYKARQQGNTVDTCPVFAEPILQAWKLPYQLLENPQPQDVAAGYKAVQTSGKAAAVLLAE